MVTELHKPGQIVLTSGIYTVVHDPHHAERHEVTAVKGDHFPTCRGCESPRFVLARAAMHLSEHPLLLPQPR
jgi:hypothetical protein